MAQLEVRTPRLAYIYLACGAFILPSIFIIVSLHTLLFYHDVWGAVVYACAGLPVLLLVSFLYYTEAKIYKGADGLRIKINDEGVWYADLSAPLPWSIIESASISKDWTGRRPTYYLEIHTNVPVDFYGQRTTTVPAPVKKLPKKFWPDLTAGRTDPRTTLRYAISGIGSAAKEILPAIQTYKTHMGMGETV